MCRKQTGLRVFHLNAWIQNKNILFNIFLIFFANLKFEKWTLS